MKTRKDFLAAARAEKWVGPVMLVQQRDREDESPDVRVGFTASKKVGNAIARNRAKRRLRAISAELLMLGSDSSKTRPQHHVHLGPT